MPISNLPAAPSTSSPSTFATLADAFIAALATFVTEANAQATLLNAGSGMGAIAIPYLIDTTTTTDADPGNGDIKFNNATQNAATTLYLDLLGSDGVTYTGVIDTFDDSTNTIKGYIRLVKISDSTKWLAFSVTAWTTATGYRKITVANIGSSAASPFVNGDAVTLFFTRAGDISAAPVNFARVTVASAATTADIWTGPGNQIDWTGTVTCTGFPAAPQAGVERVLICAGAAPFTAGANMLIDGVASASTVTCAANDIMIVRAVTTTQFRLSRVRYDGGAPIGWVLLQTATASDSTTIDLETGIGSTYDDYVIIAEGIRPTTDGSYLYATMKFAGAYVTTATYYFHLNFSASGAATYSGAAGAAGTQIAIFNTMDSANAASTGDATIFVRNVNNTSLIKLISWTGAYVDASAGSLLTAAGVGGNLSNTSALQGIRLIMSAGNIATGTFRLYGIRK